MDLKAIAIVLGLVSAAAAGTITYTLTPTTTTTISGRHVDFASTFSIPEFDSSLGALNTISFDMPRGGWLAWEVLRRTVSTSVEDYSAPLTSSFMGVTQFHDETHNAVSGGICGIVGGDLITSARCPDAHSTLGYHLGVHGVISDGYSSVGVLDDVNMDNRFSGALPTSLDQFIGGNIFSVPWLMSVDGIPPYSGMEVGPDLKGAGLSMSLSWTYGYTPPLSITSAPEPRYRTALLAIFFVGLIWSAFASSDAASGLLESHDARLGCAGRDSRGKPYSRT